MKRIVILLGALCLQQAYSQQEGKVGINTENPNATLNVKSRTGTTASTKNLELENAKETKLITVLDNGMVGINQPTPIAPLHIISPAKGYGNDVIVEDYTTYPGDPSAFIFNRNRGTAEEPLPLQKGDWVGHLIFATKNGNKNTTLATNRVAEISAQYKGDGTNSKGAITFNTSDKTRMLLNEEGKLGLNTATPTETLDVQGTTRIRELPKSGVGKIYNSTETKETTFTGVKTIVADDNGVLGYVNGIPNALTVNTNTNFPCNLDSEVRQWAFPEGILTCRKGQLSYRGFMNKLETIELEEGKFFGVYQNNKYDLIQGNEAHTRITGVCTSAKFMQTNSSILTKYTAEGINNGHEYIPHTDIQKYNYGILLCDNLSSTIWAKPYDDGSDNPFLFLKKKLVRINAIWHIEITKP